MDDKSPDFIFTITLNQLCNSNRPKCCLSNSSSECAPTLWSLSLSSTWMWLGIFTNNWLWCVCVLGSGTNKSIQPNIKYPLLNFKINLKWSAQSVNQLPGESIAKLSPLLRWEWHSQSYAGAYGCAIQFPLACMWIVRQMINNWLASIIWTALVNFA